MIRFARFIIANGMLRPRYARLLLRFAWRRYLTPAGRRWQTAGMVFFGRGLAIQIERGATVRFGKFTWIGDGTKIRCHQGTVDIGAKTVFAQTILAREGQGSQQLERLIERDAQPFDAPWTELKYTFAFIVSVRVEPSGHGRQPLG